MTRVVTIWGLLISAGALLKGQNVGIGTSTPQTRLHVHGAGGVTGGIRVTSTGTNSPTVNFYAGTATPDAGHISFGDNTGWKFHITRASDGTNMVTVQDNGNVGIGTTAPHPAALLELSATDRGFLPTRVALTSATSWAPLVGTSTDGMLIYNTATAGTGQNAVSPGYYYWRAGRWHRLTDNAYAGMIQGVLYSGSQNLTTDAPSWQYLNSYIDLPPGKWIVYSVQLLSPSSIGTSGSIWVRTMFSDNSSCSGSTPDVIGTAWLISGLLPNSTRYSILTGQVIIHNTSGSTKRYYYCGHKDPYGSYTANLVNLSTTVQGENQLYALPAE